MTVAASTPLVELRHGEVRHANGANLPRLEESAARLRGFRDRLRRRPVQLVEIDPFDPEPSQAPLALLDDFPRARGLDRRIDVHAKAEFCEDVGTA